MTLVMYFTASEKSWGTGVNIEMCNNGSHEQIPLWLANASDIINGTHFMKAIAYSLDAEFIRWVRTGNKQFEWILKV